MNYKLTITKSIPNPEYEKQVADYRERERRQWNYNEQQPQFPQAYTTVTVLDVEIPGETFTALRKAALETL